MAVVVESKTICKGTLYFWRQPVRGWLGGKGVGGGLEICDVLADSIAFER